MNEQHVAGYTTGGQPSDADIAALAARGIRTVVSVRTPGETDFDERAAVEAAGLRYVEVPFTFETLAPTHVEQLAEALHGVPPGEVFVH